MKQLKNFNKATKKSKELDSILTELKKIKEQSDAWTEQLKQVKNKLMNFLTKEGLLTEDMKGVIGEDLLCLITYRKDSTMFSEDIMQLKASAKYNELLEKYKKEIIDLELLKVKAPETYKEIIEKYSIVTRKGSYAIGEVEDI